MTLVEPQDVRTGSRPAPRNTPALLTMSAPTPGGAAGRVTPALRTPGDHARRAAVIAAGALILLLVGSASVFAATGGHWFVVQTPSMGTAAPVGTLVLTRPSTVADLQVGDVIAFHPATTPALTYTHRVVALDNGIVTTRGDINGADDPWNTTDRQLIGRAVVVLPGVGYLARALPLLLVGGLLVAGATRWWVQPGRRGPVRLLVVTVLYVVAAVTIRPFVGVRQLATTPPDPDGSATMTLVSTGLLPVRVGALPGHGEAVPVHVGYGEVAAVRLSNPPADGKYAVFAHLDLAWSQWVLLGVIWALPLLWVLVIGFRREAYPVFAAGLPASDREPVGAPA